MSRKPLLWLPAILWATVIFALTSTPAPPSIPPEFPFKDKVGHFAVYAILGALVYRALRRGHNLTLPATVALAILISSVYGVVDEWHQQFVANRSCELLDWVADTLGAAAAAAAFYAYDSRRSAKTNRQPA